MTINELPELPDLATQLPKMIVREVPIALPHPDQLSYYVLEKERRLYLDSAVDENILSIQRMILRWNLEDSGLPEAERKPIILYIYSPGGEVGYMWSLIDTIEASDTPVHTVNMGLAASAAALIFMAGRKRFMLPRSRVMIHEGSAKMSGDSVKVLDASESYRKAIRQMREYILSRTGISASVLGKQKSHDWEMDAAYCLDHGVCDAIVSHLGDVA